MCVFRRGETPDVVVDGHLLRGLHGGVGEMYALIHVEGIGEADGLGSIVARWARELARGGDDVALELVRRTGERLARIAGFFGGFYDPERIIVGGAVAAEVQGVIDVAQELLPGELHLPEPELVASVLGADVVAVGAVEALDAPGTPATGTSDSARFYSNVVDSRIGSSVWAGWCSCGYKAMAAR